MREDHYRHRYLVALSRLVEVAKSFGDYEEALAHARRLTHHDPLRNEAHREVMRLCFLLGRTGDAVQQFERCKSVLAEELGTEPSEPTVELYRRILRQRRTGIRTSQCEERASLLGNRSGVPFVGREEGRRSLNSHMEGVLAGQSGVVLVEGEPGIGKTRLGLEAADAAPEQPPSEVLAGMVGLELSGSWVGSALCCAYSEIPGGAHDQGWRADRQSSASCATGLGRGMGG